MDLLIYGNETPGQPAMRRKLRISCDDVSPQEENGDGMMNSDMDNLPPEIEEGNVEYKVKLVNPSSTRLQHLITQLKWRLREGDGQAIYELGVEDDGSLTGLGDLDLKASLDTLRKMTASLNATMDTLRDRDVTCSSSSSSSSIGQRQRVLEVLIRQVPDSQQFIELRLAVLGGADAGKSTLCGVLTQGALDNGRGKARLNLFRHLHEIHSGRTSSVCMDVIGFDDTGKLVNYAENTLEDVVRKSIKLVTLIDLAGHDKYLKTTIYGLTGLRPHRAVLVVAAGTVPGAMFKEHLGLAISLQLPVFVVISKIDMVNQAAINKTLSHLEKLLKRTCCRAVRMNSRDDVINVAKQLTDGSTCTIAEMNSQIVPIFTVSSVSGTGLNLLECFLNVLPPFFGLSRINQDLLCQSPPLLQIEEVFNVPNVGSVVSGLLSEGVMREGDRVLVGPDRNGHFRQAFVDSVRRVRQPVSEVRAGQAASLALIPVDEPFYLRKGMMVLKEISMGCVCLEFDARIYLLYHTTSDVCLGFQATVYIGAVCQTATIINFDGQSIVPLQWTRVRFKFFCRPEFLRMGAQLIFRQGKTRGMGEVLMPHVLSLSQTE